ncbi:MAG: hypothetical protein HYS98_06745 [Deltaproteobacteria bacterium]|nr:hypothetical protein [Deltaproteobacteria bacterium]
MLKKNTFLLGVLFLWSSFLFFGCYQGKDVPEKQGISSSQNHTERYATVSNGVLKEWNLNLNNQTFDLLQTVANDPTKTAHQVGTFTQNGAFIQFNSDTVTFTGGGSSFFNVVTHPAAIRAPHYGLLVMNPTTRKVDIIPAPGACTQLAKTRVTGSSVSSSKSLSHITPVHYEGTHHFMHIPSNAYLASYHNYAYRVLSVAFSPPVPWGMEAFVSHTTVTQQQFDFEDQPLESSVGFPFQTTDISVTAGSCDDSLALMDEVDTSSQKRYVVQAAKAGGLIAQTSVQNRTVSAVAFPPQPIWSLQGKKFQGVELNMDGSFKTIEIDLSRNQLDESKNVVNRTHVVNPTTGDDNPALTSEFAYIQDPEFFDLGIAKGIISPSNNPAQGIQYRLLAMKSQTTEFSKSTFVYLQKYDPASGKNTGAFLVNIQ